VQLGYTAQNSSDNFRLLYPPDNHHSSDEPPAVFLGVRIAVPV